MRIDTWIRTRFPELRAEQDTSVQNQLADNEKALSPDIRSQFAKVLVDANSSMNAAYAKFWSKQFAEPRYQLPFKALGYNSPADQLLGALDTIPDEPTADRQLIEHWAEKLGLSTYCHFQSHQFDD